MNNETTGSRNHELSFPSFLSLKLPRNPRAQGVGLRRLVSPPSNPQSPAARTPGATPQPQFTPWGSGANGKCSLGSHLGKAKLNSALALALLPGPALPLCEPALSSPRIFPGTWPDSRVSSRGLTFPSLFRLQCVGWTLPLAHPQGPTITYQRDGDAG